MARKLEAGLDGRYLMSSVLMTSTMKSEPGMPLTRASSRGVPVSAAATCAVGASADGLRAGPVCTAGLSAAPACRGASAVAAPAAMAPVRNCLRPAFGPDCLRVIGFSPAFALQTKTLQDLRQL